MIQVEPTKDLAYIESVLGTAGMSKLCGVTPNNCDIHGRVIQPENIFMAVRKDGKRMGFISFGKISDTIAEIHLALKTRGNDTLQAIRQAIAEAKHMGFLTVIAAYRSKQEAITRLAKMLGFEDIGTTFYDGEIFKVIKLTT